MKGTALFVLLAALAFEALAAPVRLDDSASPRSRVEVKPRWQFVEEGLSDPARLNAIVAEIPNLEVRLATAKFVGKQARVYMVVPDFVPGLRSPSGMRVEWRTRGKLLGGSALPGTRALVYDGLVGQPILGDYLDMTLYRDARFLDRGLRFEPYFEIDVAP
jgi:hypothetical protein